MNKKWKLLAFLMTAYMVITMIPMTAFADGDPAPGSFAALQALIDNVDAGGTVKLEQNYTFADTDKGPITIESGKTVTIDLDGHTIDRGLAGATEAVQDGRIFTVSGTLTIQDTGTETGGKITGGFSSTDGGAILVGEGGVLNLESGEISGNRINNYRGNGGGAIQISKGTFNMSGGKISGNVCDRVYGGGGAVYSYYGTINMSGGEISGNTANPFSNGGGGVYLNRSTMTMSGNAKISDNFADGEGNIGRGGGVYLSVNSTFNMEDGEISNNRAALDGGGICVSNESTFNMSGGEISGNKALGKVPQWSLGLGGGILASDATVIIKGGSIKNNEANQDGGGIYLRSYGGRVTTSLTMNGGEISNNTAGSYTPEDPEDEESAESATGSGGGVYLSDGVRFTMNGGKISGNQSFGSAGGVMDAGSKSFTINGGTIQNNIAHNEGGGIFYNGESIVFSGSVLIKENLGSAGIRKVEDEESETYELYEISGTTHSDNLCLLASTNNDKTMDIAGLDTGSEIYLWVYGNKYEGDPVITDDTTKKNCLKSDDAGYLIIEKDGRIVLSSVDDPVYAASWAKLNEYLQNDSIKKIIIGSEVETVEVPEFISPDKNSDNEYDKAPLTVSPNGDKVLDLNGHSIDRKLEESPQAEGYVFDVQGTLAITNSAEKDCIITGGNNTGDGGGIYVNYGTVMINSTRQNSISITGNKAKYGAGVYVRDGLLAMNYGSIDNNNAEANAGGVGVYGGGSFVSYETKINENTAADCSGVYVRDAGSQFIAMGGEVKDNKSTNNGLAAAGIYIRSTNGFMVANNPVISGNLNVDGAERNVSLDNGKTITLTPVQEALGKLEIRNIAVEAVPTEAKAIVITSGLNNREVTFTSANQDYKVMTNADGEVVFALESSISFDANGGSGTMEPQAIALGTTNKLKKNTFSYSGYR